LSLLYKYLVKIYLCYFNHYEYEAFGSVLIGGVSGGGGWLIGGISGGGGWLIGGVSGGGGVWNTGIIKIYFIYFYFH